MHLDSSEAHWFNNAMARLATSYVVGPSAALVERLTAHIGEHTNVSGLMDAWPMNYRTKLAHAKDWHRLVTATADNRAPNKLRDLQEIDAEVLASSWCPPVSVMLNVREFPTGLKRTRNAIQLTLATPPNYQDYIMSSATN